MDKRKFTTYMTMWLVAKNKGSEPGFLGSNPTVPFTNSET